MDSYELECFRCSLEKGTSCKFPISEFELHNEHLHPDCLERCTECLNVFETVQEKNLHIHLTHLCIQCLKSPGLENYLLDNEFHGHYKQLHREAKLKCNFCPNKFSPGSVLEDHKKVSHWQDKKLICQPIQCWNCNESFPDKKKMQEHTKTRHPKFKFLCQNCFNGYTSRKLRDDHSRDCRVRCA